MVATTENVLQNLWPSKFIEGTSYSITKEYNGYYVYQSFENKSGRRWVHYTKSLSQLVNYINEVSK